MTSDLDNFQTGVLIWMIGRCTKGYRELVLASTSRGWHTVIIWRGGILRSMRSTFGLRCIGSRCCGLTEWRRAWAQCRVWSSRSNTFWKTAGRGVSGRHRWRSGWNGRGMGSISCVRKIALHLRCVNRCSQVRRNRTHVYQRGSLNCRFSQGRSSSQCRCRFSRSLNKSLTFRCWLTARLVILSLQSCGRLRHLWRESWAHIAVRICDLGERFSYERNTGNCGFGLRYERMLHERNSLSVIVKYFCLSSITYLILFLVLHYRK